MRLKNARERPTAIHKSSWLLFIVHYTKGGQSNHLPLKDIDNAYAIFLEGRAKKVLNIRREEVERKLEVKELEVNVLKRLLGQKGNKDGLLAHIIGIYARLSDTNEIITGMESDQREMSATIDSLKIAIRREQQKTATAKRSITAQKGMITKRLNALDLETSNRDTEWISLTSKLSKERGYNKMIATKNSNTLERKMNIIKENNIEITSQKFRFPYSFLIASRKALHY